MLLKQVLDLFEVLDTPQASGETVKKMLLEAGGRVEKFNKKYGRK